MNKQQKAFVGLTSLMKIIGEEFDQWSLYNISQPYRYEMANDYIFEDYDWSPDEMIQMEKEMANHYRKVVLDKNQEIDQLTFFQECFTEAMRDLWSERKQRGTRFGELYGMIEQSLYSTILTKTILKADEGNDLDQIVTQMNAIKHELEIRN